MDISKAAFPGDPEYLTGLLLDSEGKFVKFLERENYSYRSSKIQIQSQASGELKPIMILLKPGEFQPGEYEVIPYLLIQQTLPSGLIESIDGNATDFSQDFLNYPLKIQNNKYQL